jgi:hypothetical protein
VRVLRLAIAMAAWTLVLESAASSAQPRAMRDVIQDQLEPTYLVFPVPIAGLDPVWYEAQLAAHFFAHRAAWPFALVVSPHAVVRLFREYGEPVKTPSYMPRVTLFAWSARARPAEARVTYASLALGHHSNGQAGPPFLPGRRLNHETGDFYTNYVELALHTRAAERAWLESMRVALQVHPPPLQQPQLVGRYGMLHAQLGCTLLDGIASGGSVRMDLGATLDGIQHFARDTISRRLERFSIEVTYTHGFPEIELALFARYYLGRDYYNIWFDRVLHTIQLGISSQLPVLEP